PREPLLDLRLRRRQRLGERGGDRTLALRELAAVVIGKLPLLLDELRDGIRAGAGERALEVDGALGNLLLDELAQAGLRLAQMRVDLLTADQHALESKCSRRSEHAAQQPAGSDGKLARMRVTHRKHDPCGEGCGGLERCERDERGPGKLPTRGTCKRQCGDRDSRGEDDVEGVRQLHRTIVGAQADRASRSAPASNGSATASSWSATSAGRDDAVSPSWRRAKRTCVDRVRCARLAKTAKAAAANASPRKLWAEAKYAVSTGKAPHASANQRSERNAPPKSSRLY